MRATLVLAAAAALLLAGQSLAQTPIDDSLDARSARRLDNLEKVVKELRAIVFQGRETGAPVVVQPAETQGQITGLGDRLGDLDHSLTRLNGEMEVVRHDLDEARHESEDLRVQNAALKAQVADLAQKVAAMTAPPPPPPPTAEQAPPPPADPAAAFVAARALYAQGDMAGAEAAFHDYVERFGENPRGPEAHYYLGRVLAARRAWPEAATADIAAIRGWPQTRWAPEAVLGLARALIGMGKNGDACQTLGELARRYPKAAPSVVSGARAARGEAGCS
jgi:TolA-binding protein